MARTHQIMDGVDTVDLLSADIAGRLGGFGSSRSSPDSDLPAGLIRIPESYKLRITGTDQDDVATNVRSLVSMLRKAKQHHTKSWQTTPVYLKSQTDNETNPRYAMIYGCPELDQPDYFDPMFSLNDILLNVGLTIIRGVWGSQVPGALPSALTLTATDGPASQTLVHVSNFRDDTALTHIYNYDDNLAAWSANQYDQTGITLWAVSGSTPVADDILYVGSTTAAWRHWVIKIATAGVFTANVKVEYWNGAWVELTAGTEFTIYPTGGEDEIFKSIDDWVLNVKPPDDWVANEINTVTAHWIRLYLTAVTDWTTTPVSHGTHAPYFQKTPYIEVADSILKGDIPPIVLLRIFSPHGALTSPCMGACSRIIMGSRSHHLTKFDPFLNLGDEDNDADWTLTLSADTTKTADPMASAGYHAACDFSTSTLMVSRIQAVGTNLLDDYRGEFRVFLRAEQVGGADGDLSVKLRTAIGSTADQFPKSDTEIVKLKTHDEGWELIDLGILHIPFGEITAADSAATDLIFQVMASRGSGSATITFNDLITMPKDEWTVGLDDPISNVELGSSALRGDTVLDLDDGVLMNRIVKYIRSGSTLYTAERWYRTGEPTRLEPGKQTRLYFLMMHFPTDWGSGPFLSPLGMHLAVELRASMAYLSLRGDN